MSATPPASRTAPAGSTAGACGSPRTFSNPSVRTPWTWNCGRTFAGIPAFRLSLREREEVSSRRKLSAERRIAPGQNILDGGVAAGAAGEADVGERIAEDAGEIDEIGFASSSRR